MAAYGAFCAYAIAAAVVSGGRDQVWAIWAACGYAAALAMLWRWRSRRGRIAAVGVSVALAVLAPLLWLSVAYPLEDGMVVIDRSAALLLHHGSPYLPASQVTSWLSYNPYLPVMTLFGLPHAAGLAAWRELRGVDRDRHGDPARRGVLDRRSGTRAPGRPTTRCSPPRSPWPRPWWGSTWP